MRELSGFKPHAQKPIVFLSDEFTHIGITDREIEEAIESALWLTASPHEWSWTQEQQIMMARYCLAAHQRLSIMRYVATAQDVTHNPKGASD